MSTIAQLQHKKYSVFEYEFLPVPAFEGYAILDTTTV
jgi:hypothetical protein